MGNTNYVRGKSELNLDKQIEAGDVGAKNLSGLAVELSTNNTLVTLILSRNSIEDKSGIEIAKSLVNHQVLKTLNLSDNLLGDGSATSLADLLMKNNTLKTLSLDRNQISNAGIKKLAEALGKNQGLTSLSLSQNNVAISGLKSLAEVLQSDSCPLIYLNLSANQLGVEGVQIIVDSIVNNTVLKTLILYSNNIGPGSNFDDLIKNNTTLTTLNLYNNNLGPEGGAKLMIALKQNTTLSVLNLNRTQMGDEATKKLAECLKTNHSITTLSIGANKIGVDSGCKLIESLKFNTKLSTLNIGVNKLGVEGASKFGELLRNNTSLTNLIVEGNQFGNKGIAKITEALLANNTLSFLNIDRNNIDDQGGKLILDMLQKNTSITNLNFDAADVPADLVSEIYQRIGLNRDGKNFNVVFDANLPSQIFYQRQNPSDFGLESSGTEIKIRDDDVNESTLKSCDDLILDFVQANEINTTKFKQIHDDVLKYEFSTKLNNTPFNTSNSLAKSLIYYNWNLQFKNTKSIVTGKEITTEPQSSTATTEIDNGAQTTNRLTGSFKRKNAVPNTVVERVDEKKEPEAIKELDDDDSEKNNFYFQLNKALQERKENNCINQFSGYLYYFQSAMMKVPNFSGIVYRSYNEKDLTMPIIREKYRIGQVLQFSSYLSSTGDLALAQQYSGQTGIIIQYQVLNGKNISRYSPLPLFSEVILSPNMKFVIYKPPYVGKDGFNYVKVVQIFDPEFLF